MGFRYATSLIFDNRSNVRKQIICHLRLQDITIDGFTHPSFFVFQTFVYPAIDKITSEFLRTFGFVLR